MTKPSISAIQWNKKCNWTSTRHFLWFFFGHCNHHKKGKKFQPIQKPMTWILLVNLQPFGETTTLAPNASTTTEKYRISRAELGKILSRNFRGLQKLMRLEIADAKNVSIWSSSGFSKELNIFTIDTFYIFSNRDIQSRTTSNNTTIKLSRLTKKSKSVSLNEIQLQIWCEN